MCARYQGLWEHRDIPPYTPYSSRVRIRVRARVRVRVLVVVRVRVRVRS